MSDLVTFSKSLIVNTSVPLIDYLHKSWCLEDNFLNTTGSIPSTSSTVISSTPFSITLSPVNNIEVSSACVVGIDELSIYSSYIAKLSFTKFIYNLASALNLPISVYLKDASTAIVLLHKHTNTSILSQLLFLEETALLKEQQLPISPSYEIDDFISDTSLGSSRNEYLNTDLGTMWNLELFFRLSNVGNEGNLIYIPDVLRAYVASSTCHVEVLGAGSVNELVITSSNEYNKLEISRFDNVFKIFLNGYCLGVIKKENVEETLDIYVGYYLHPSDSLSSTTFQGLFRNLKVYAGFPNYYQYEYFTPEDVLKPSTELHYAFFISEDERVSNVARTLTSDTSTEPFLSSNMLNEYSHFEIDGSPIEIEGDFTIEAEVKNTSGNTRGTIALYGDSTEFNWHLGIYDSKARFEIGSVVLDSISNVSTLEVTSIGVTREGTNVKLYVNGVEEASGTYTGNTIQYTGKTLRVKRKEGQSTAIATTNTTLYPSKSRIFISSLRYTSVARHSSSYTYIKGLIYG